jgi:hypothetical protein
MLRASATATDQEGELRAVQDPSADGAVDAAPELAALVDAIVEGDAAGATRARAALVAELGAEAVIDAAAVVANFEMMTRIADGTGARHETIDADVARATGADRFPSAPGPAPTTGSARSDDA